MLGTASTGSVYGCAPVTPLASVAVTVMFEEPTAPGVPEMTPEAPASVSPPGSVPAVTAKVYGARPPAAASAIEYDRPWYASASEGVDTATGDSVATERLRLAVTPLASVSVTVKLEEPAVVGVPVMVPPLESESPAGSAPDVTAKV